jgi:ribosome biogenesis protein Tsr3
MTLDYPPTVIVRSPHENPRKCSILPLKGRNDVFFLEHPVRDRPDLSNYVRLAVDGVELAKDDASCGILLLDGSWRRADSMVRDYLDVPPRSLRGYRTAYPRISKRGSDPDSGLATEGLLDHYRWRDEFLRLNGFVS